MKTLKQEKIKQGEYMDANLLYIENLKCCGNCIFYDNDICVCCSHATNREMSIHANAVCPDWEFDGIEAKDRRGE